MCPRGEGGGREGELADPRASAHTPPRAPQVLTCTPASPALAGLLPLMSYSTSSRAWGLEEGKAHVTDELVCTCEHVHLVEGNPGTQPGVGGGGVAGHLEPSGEGEFCRLG